jgi:branched-chain amino acid transport system substrate-binding protein
MEAVRRSRRVAFALVAMLAAVVIAACGSSSNNSGSGGGASSTGSAGASTSASGSSTSSGGGGSGTPITIGVQFGVTGVDSAFDSIYNDATKLVFGQVKSINGHPLKVVYADDASDAGTAVAVTRKFISENHVSALYGPAFTDSTLATAHVADAEKIPLYTPGSISPLLTAPFQKYVFAPQFTSNNVADGIAALANSMHAKKVGLLEEDDDYGKAALSGASAALKKYGLKVNTVEQISATATDATSQMLAFKNAGDQVVLLGVTAPPMEATLNAEIHTATFIPVITFAGSTTALDTLAKSAKSIKYYALTPLGCNLGAACTKSFLAAWNKAYPSTPAIVWAGQAYAAAQAFLAGLKHATSYDASGVVSGLENMPAFKSRLLPCPIKFSSSSHLGTKCTSFYGITDGKVSFFGPTLDHNDLAKG